jgi:glycosyltransferase involved in cell wall biosynthesis
LVLHKTDFPKEVSYIFHKNNLFDYEKAAYHINSSEVDIVNLQHEFGLFGGPEGRHLTKLLEKLNKPIVTTLHTVLQSPNLGYYTSLKEIVQYSHKLIVMSEKAIEILKEVYYVNPEKIKLIHHGVPDLPFSDTEGFKKKFGFSGRYVILTFGLLNPGKGIEVSLESLPEITKRFPNILYVILGQTHPEVKKIHGEKYRDGLLKMVKNLSIEENVLFIDKFLENEELFEYIKSADMYLTPYLSPDQITSGSLAYAVGLGKCIISTPYWYAMELLSDDRGILVPFNDPKAIRDAITKVLLEKEVELSMRNATYDFGRQMIWSKVAREYNETFKAVYKKHRADSLKSINANKKSLDSMGWKKVYDMFNSLTDKTGIIQHTIYGIPDFKHGYSADDVGRALAVLMRISHQDNKPRYYRLSKVYLSFLRYAQRGDGRFHNFLSYDKRFLDEVGSEDTFGRVLMGLGATLSFSQEASMTLLAKELFDNAIKNLHTELPISNHIKALAYSISGLYGYFKRYPEEQKVIKMMKTGADYLITLYNSNICNDWRWFENTLTYSNAKVCHSLMLAYNVLKEKSYLDVALESLDFITKIQFDGEFFDLVGNKDWCHRDSEKSCFDQQPVEIGYLVEAYSEAYRITNNKEYIFYANRAFDWFFGRNAAGLPVYDVKNNYPLDGLGPHGCNYNSGAESVISFSLALVCLKELNNRNISEKITKKMIKDKKSLI